MKKVTLFFAVCIVCLNSFSQDFKKLDNSEIDTSKCQLAKKFSTEFYTNLKNGLFYQFKDEAIEPIKNQMTEQIQKATYKQIRDNFGDFKSLSYVETWIQLSNPDVEIFRFIGFFDKSNDKLEIRVVINKSGKIAGFWIKPWLDNLQ